MYPHAIPMYKLKELSTPLQQLAPGPTKVTYSYRCVVKEHRGGSSFKTLDRGPLGNSFEGISYLRRHRFRKAAVALFFVLAMCIEGRVVLFPIPSSLLPNHAEVTSGTWRRLMLSYPSLRLSRCIYMNTSCTLSSFQISKGVLPAKQYSQLAAAHPFLWCSPLQHSSSSSQQIISIHQRTRLCKRGQTAAKAGPEKFPQLSQSAAGILECSPGALSSGKQAGCPNHEEQAQEVFVTGDK